MSIPLLLKNEATTAVLVIAFLLVMALRGEANPTGGSLQQGAASWSSSGPVLTVNQTSDRAVINWNSFSIGAGETTRFNQPSSGSAVLNRVVGSDLSSIYGNLSSNGQVFLINPNGIIIGARGIIKTSAFVASTLDVENAQFMSGSDLLFGGSSQSVVQNLGSITATGGDVHLIAQTVRNDGAINASHGTVGLAAGTQVLLQQEGQEKLFVQPTGANGTVINSGTIRAINAELKADNGNVYAMAIQNSGVVRATGAARVGGHVYFTASGGGKILNSGTVIANGSRGGGTIDVRAAGDINITATGLLQADATKSGNGGAVHVVSSGGLTDFAGKIEATGIGEGSIGGNAEVSGANLHITGLADLRGPAGDGTLLYDPGSIEILSSGVVDYFNTFLASTISTQLATANVTLSTANATNGGTQNITLDSGAAINWSSANTLTLLAGANIIINGTIANTGSGSLVLHADSNALGGPGTGTTNTISFGSAGVVNFAGGTGTVSFYYDPMSYTNPTAFTVAQVKMGANPANFVPFMLVNNATQLQGASAAVNTGNANVNDDFALGTNIDMSGVANFTPIGNYGANSAYIYHGVFNGYGYTISNLTSNLATGPVGLIGYNDGTLENLVMTSVAMTGQGDVGGAVGINHTTGVINNVTVTGVVTGPGANYGGVAGNNYNLIENSSAAVPVSATGIDGSSTGGLVGYNEVGGLIQNCHASGTSYATEYFAGGLVGSNFGTINNSYATGNVSGYVYDGGLVGALGGSGIIEYSYATGTATSQANVGGLVGTSGGLIEYSYATGAVSGAYGQAGGLVGILGSGAGPGTIEYSYASGNVTGGYELGGLVGESYPGTIENSYATGSVTATDSTSVVGGLVGYTGGFYNGVTTVPGYVTDSYALGTVNGTYFVGGLAGENGPGGTVATSYAAGKVVALGIAGGLTGYNAGTQTNNYWDKTVDSGVTYGNGDDPSAPSNTGATPETTSAMMAQSTFTGFSFPSTWRIQEGLTRPYLSFQPVISGTAKNGGVAVSGLTVNLVSAGTQFATEVTNSSGYYVDVLNPGDIAAGTGVLALSGNPVTLNANAFGIMPGAFGSLTGLDLNANTLTINSPTASSSNSVLATALGSYAGGGNVFTTGAGNSVTLNSGIGLLTTAATAYTIDGNLGVATGDLNATFDGSINTGASTVAIAAGNGTVDFASTLTLGGALSIATTGGITLSGNVLDNDHNLTLNGPVTTTGGITIGNIGNIAGADDTGNTVTFANTVTLGGNLIAIGGNISVENGLSGAAYNLTLRATDGAANLSGAVTADNVLVTASGASGNVVLNSGATVTAMAGTAQDLILAATDAFQNNAGSAALAVNGGTWLVYSNKPDIDTFGSLNSNNQAIWNQPYTSINPAVSGDRYIFTNQPVLTAVSTNDSKNYGQVIDLSADYSISGFANASNYGNVFIQDVAANTLTGAFVLTSPGNLATATVAGSPYVITLSQGTEASVNGYAFSLSSPGRLTVNPLGVSVAIGNATSTYGTNPDLSGVTLTSGSTFANGQTISDLGLVVSTTYDHNSNAGTYLNAITATSSNTNYIVTYTGGTLTINPLGVNVTVGNASSTYGTNPDLSGVTFTSASSFANGQSVSDLGLVAATTEDHNTNVGTYVGAITASASNANYAVTYTNGTLTVNPLGVNVTVGNDSSTYGTNPDLSGVTFTSASTFANGQSVSDLGLVAATTLDHNTDVGTYVGAITASSSNNNYTVTYTNGTLTVNPLGVNVTIGNATSTYGTNPDLSGVTLTSGSTFANGQSISDLGLVVSTTKDHNTDAGTYLNAITATSSNSNYNVTYTDGTLTINPFGVDVTVGNATSTYGTNPDLSGVTFTSASTFANGQSISDLGLVAATTEDHNTNVGTYLNAITASSTNNNYNVTYTDGTLTVNPLGVNVTIGNATSTYGTNPDLSGVTFTSASTFANGQSVSDLGLVAATTEDHNTNVGTYVGVITASSSNNNYDITYTDGNLTVNPLGVDVIIGNASSTYGTNPDVSGVTFTSASTFANGQSVNDLGLVASTVLTSSTNAGTYAGAITASSSNNNYSITYTDGTLLVNQALLNFQVADSIKYSGDPNPAFTGTWSGFVLGQDPSVLTGALLYSTTATNSSPVGSYAVTASGLTSPNYDISYSPGTLSVLSQIHIQTQMSQQDYALFSDEVRFSPKASFGKGVLRYEGNGWKVGPSLAHGSSWSIFR